MRIAIIQPNHDATGLGGSYERAFGRLGMDVRRHWITSRDGPSVSHLHRAVDRLRRVGEHRRGRAAWRRMFEEVAGSAPDLVIMTRCETVPVDLLAEFRRTVRAPLWNIYPDTPYNYPGAAYLAEHPLFEQFDAMFTHSSGLVPAFHAFGARRAMWLPFAADPELHVARPPSPDPEVPVSYLGTWAPMVTRWLEHLVPYGLAIYGFHWFKLPKDHPVRSCWRAGEGMAARMADAVAGHAVQFSIARPEAGTTHSMKPFELAICGGTCLMNRIPDNEIFFADGREMLLYDNREEMLDGLHRLLADADLRAELRAAAMARASRQTYVERATALLGYYRDGHLPRGTDWL